MKTIESPVPRTGRDVRTDYETMFAGAVVGDNWVVMALVHADRLGQRVVPIRVRHAFFEAHPGQEPAIQDVERAFERCWNSLGSGQDFEHSRFVLCLPPRSTLSRMASARVSTHPDGPFRSESSVVTAAHLRQLEARVARDGFWPRYAVADLVPLGYVVDDTQAADAPCGMAAGNVELNAHLVLTQHDSSRLILDCLRGMDLNVDVLMSPFAALAGNLTADERNAEALAIDVDRLTTSCAFFSDGRLIHTAWVDGGSYEVLQDAARRLNTAPEDLALWLNERADIALPSEPGGDMQLPLYPSWQAGPSSLVDLDIAARKAAAVIAGRLLATIQTAAGRLALRPRRAIITGDDSLTLRALIANLYQNGIVCEARGELDTDDGPNMHLAMPGMARLIGMMRTTQRGVSAQPFLDAYNAAPAIRTAPHRPSGATTGSVTPRWTPPTPMRMPSASVRTPRASRRPQLAAALAQMLF